MGEDEEGGDGCWRVHGVGLVEAFVGKEGPSGENY